MDGWMDAQFELLPLVFNSSLQADSGLWQSFNGVLVARDVHDGNAGNLAYPSP